MIDLPSLQAPESREGAVTDRRTDVWSFGATMHEIITGSEFRPWAPLPVIFAGTVPPQLADLVNRCLQPVAEDRPTAEEAAAACRALDPHATRDKVKAVLERHPLG
jgi:serine/threonine protein kinase